MKIWHISDTHTYHGLLDIPENIDMVIHSGDATNPKDLYYRSVIIKLLITFFKKIFLFHKDLLYLYIPI